LTTAALLSMTFGFPRFLAVCCLAAAYALGRFDRWSRSI
jgi:hypothetical protein